MAKVQKTYVTNVKFHSTKMAETNRQLQFQGPSAPLQLVTSRVPEVPANGLVIKTEWAGICHSDVYIWKNQFKLADEVVMGWAEMYPDFGWKWPIVMGHEVFGRVWQLGSDVGKDTAGLSVGDRVVVFSWMGCGECGYCKHERSNLCEESGKHDLGCSINTQGGYQDYVAVRDVRYACKLPDSIPGDMGCLLGCSALTAFNACKAVKRSVTTAIEMMGKGTVLILGAGGLGQWAISFIKALFPKETKVFAADASEENLALAKERGAETILWSRDAEQKDIIALTKSTTGGIDAAIDFIGLPMMLDRAFNCANKNATLVEIGIAGGTGKFSTMGLILRNISVIGLYTGNLDDIRELIQLCSKHPEIRPPAITHVQPQETEEVLKKLDRGTYTGRAVIDFRSKSTNL